MFIDKASIQLKAGRGGDGAISWRREAFIPSGGPDGGDGGRGGSIYFMADNNVATLLDFKYKRTYKAESGMNGMGKKMAGKSGQDLYLKVPVGTVIREKESLLPIADLTEDGETFLAVKGGRGGKGNTHFKNSVRQAPRFAIPGQHGQELGVVLEVKLIADVGLVGLPNVGKSTILSILSNARPKIANYHFTTLSPNLGVVDIDHDLSFVLADIPGLVEGASSGAGLGDDFLRHIERTRVLVHVLDMAGSEGRDPYQDYLLIQEELASYNEALPDRVKIIVANKMDLPGGEEGLTRFKEEIGETSARILPLSAATTQGIKELKYAIADALKDLPRTLASFDEDLVDVNQFFKRDEGITVERKEDTIFVTGEPVKDLVRRLIITDEGSVRFFERRLEDMGVMDQIREKNPTENDTIDVEGFQFDWL